MVPARRPWSRMLVVTAMALAVTLGHAADGSRGFQLDLDIDTAVHDAFDAENLRARVSWVERQPSFELRADGLRLPEPVGRIRDLHLSCPRVDLTTARLACAQARLSATAPGWHLDAAMLAFDWDRSAGRVHFSLPWPGLFQGRGRVAGAIEAAGVRVDLDLAGIDLHALIRSGLMPAELPVTVESGLAALSGQIDTRTRVPAVRTNLALSGLTFTDDAGLRAGEAVAVEGSLRHGGDGSEIQLRFTDGAVFFDPWFLDFAEVGPVDASVSGLRFGPAEMGTKDLHAVSAQLTLGDHAEVHGADLRYAGGKLEQGDIAWEGHRLDVVGEWLAQPLLAGTVLGRTRFQGEARGALSVADGRPRAAWAHWQAFGMKDEGGRFALEGSVGQLDWRDDKAGADSRIFAAAGEIYGLPVGAFDARLRLEPRGFVLLEPLFIPVLDGGPSVDTLQVTVGPDGPEVEFDGGLRAMSLELLTEALGWPRFAGKLAGIIPRVFYDTDGLRVDGRLLVQVFDGEAVFSGLRIRDLFGVAPVLEVSADIRRLELELLTRAFDFGRVEGRLSGRVDDLMLVDWQLQRMRLVLNTPLDDPGRRRISQRAVENLTAIGGGIEGALSMVFLRLFEDFAYRQLGFSCALDGEVCVAAGVADLPDGSFVLVQGGGLPRIEVIGHNRRVDWPELVRRLNAIREGPPPVVQ
ncbi:MAG: hypothetical protein EA346_01645 [Thioalkalivibrio sp.]|nr:MAG: hypothetical protein EA346_01645 [Thioalkalivibrio sp.]